MGLLRPIKWVNWCEDLDKLQKECDNLRKVRHSLPKKSKEWWVINKQLSDKIDLVNNDKEINIFNEWQKEFKTGEIDYDLLHYSLEIDKIYSGNAERSLVVTCLDQRPDFKFNYDKLRHFNQIYESYSPDSKTFKKIK